MVRRLLLIAVTVLMIVGALPASAVNVPVVSSDNVEVLHSFPDVAAISAAFASDSPTMYVSTLKGLSAYDISAPAQPRHLSTFEFAYWQNEAAQLGERVVDGKPVKFILVGLDGIYAVSPTDSSRRTSTSAKELVVVDVTNPTSMRIRGRVQVGTSTHTVSCVNPECTHAYSAGSGSTFSIIDMTDLDKPVEIAKPKTAVGGFAGHDWDLDAQGIFWHVGAKGTVGFDVSNPTNPVPVAGTNAAGGKAPYNNFIHHNSIRPHAENFVSEGRDATGTPITRDAALDAGNVMLITEEDYLDPTCQGGEGSFQTWRVPYVDAQQYAGDNPDFRPAQGKIEPLDMWNTELLDSGRRSIAGALCSAHYFTYHEGGFVAQGWYQQGTRILDVRDPSDIKQVGYFFTGASETWSAYWVPEYDASGHQTGRDTNLVYTADVRGIDVLRVGLPTTAPAETAELRAPILPQWLAGTAPAGASAPSKDFGYLCRLSPASL